MEGLAVVPYAPPCVCKGCAKTSADKPWGCYRYDAVLKQWQPVEDGCQDCVKTLQDTVAPQELTWKAFGPRLQEPQTAATRIGDFVALACPLSSTKAM